MKGPKEIINYRNRVASCYWNPYDHWTRWGPEHFSNPRRNLLFRSQYVAVWCIPVCLDLHSLPTDSRRSSLTLQIRLRIVLFLLSSIVSRGTWEDICRPDFRKIEILVSDPQNQRFCAQGTRYSNNTHWAFFYTQEKLISFSDQMELISWLIFFFRKKKMKNFMNVS